MLTYIRAVLVSLLGGAAAVLPLPSTFIAYFADKITGGTAGEFHYFFGMVLFGAATAIVITYYKSIYSTLFSSKLNNVTISGRKKVQPFTFKEFIIGISPLIVLFLPVGKGVFLFNLSDMITDRSLLLIEGIAMIASGILYFAALAKSLKRHEYKKMNNITAACVGVSQILASVVPGISRTAVTFSVGSLFNMRNAKSVTYSYIIALPALLFGGFFNIIVAASTTVAVPVASMIIAYVFSVFAALFGIIVFNNIAGKKNSRVFSYINVVCGLMALIAGAVQLFLK